MLDTEFKYYLDNQADLIKTYDKKYLIIVGEKLMGVYDSKDAAYFEGTEKYGLGSFLLQYCAPGNMFYTQTFYTQNVTF